MATGIEDASVLEEELMCSVCLDLYRDPHLLPCGHNFCLSCLQRLKSHLDRGRLRCPECQQSHRCSAPWQKNFKLANITERFRHHGQGEGPGRSQQSQSHRTDGVCCDYCSREATGKDSKAVKTCLKCEVSMCSEHMQPHLELPVFKDHPLVKPLSDMRKRKCAEHDEMFRYYCMDDSTFLCNACTIEGGHSGHTIKTLKNATRDMKSALESQMQKVDRMMRRTEKTMQDQKKGEEQNKTLLENLSQHVDVLQGVLRTKLDGFLASLCESAKDREREHSLSIQQSVAQITMDQTRLGVIRTGIGQLLQESDHFQFIKEYNSCFKRYRRRLRMPLFLPDSSAINAEALKDSMEGKMDAFMLSLRNQIFTVIDSVCKEGDEGGQEDEDDSEENDVDDDSEEDGEEEEGFTSTSEEEEEEVEEEEELEVSIWTDEDFFLDEEEELDMEDE